MTPEQHELLKKIAAFPLESQNTLKRDDDLIYGFNDWRLTVADVKRARAMLDTAAPAPTSPKLIGERDAIEKIQQTLSEAILRLTNCLERQDWHPSRSHIEGARNTMDDAIKALDAVDAMLAEWALPAGDAAATRAAEVAQLKETVEDLRSTMDAWFDLSKKTEEEITPILIDGLKGYLRTAKNGGMSTKAAATAEAVLTDYCRLYAGLALLPVLRGLASSSSEASIDAAVSEDLIERCKELVEWRSTGLLHNGSGGSLRAYAERLAATGIGEHYALSVAESNTASEAMKELARMASAKPRHLPTSEGPPASETTATDAEIDKITEIIDQAVGDGEFIGRNHAGKAQHDAVVAVRSKAALAALFPQLVPATQAVQSDASDTETPSPGMR